MRFLEIIGTAPRAWKRAICLTGSAIVLVMAAASPGAADQIRLKNGTEFSGKVVNKDHAHVVVGLSRSEVEAINGKTLPPPIAAGAKAPVVSAVDLAGAERTVGGAGQPMLIQFWATWCPHCRRDLPLLKELSAQYHGTSLNVVAVSVDQDQHALRAFVEEQALPFPVVAAYDEKNLANGSISDRYEIEGIPAYYLVDATGTIVKTWFGSVIESGGDLEQAVKDLMTSAVRPSPSRSGSAEPPRPTAEGAEGHKRTRRWFLF